MEPLSYIKHWLHEIYFYTIINLHFEAQSYSLTQINLVFWLVNFRFYF